MGKTLKKWQIPDMGGITHKRILYGSLKIANSRYEGNLSKNILNG